MTYQEKVDLFIRLVNSHDLTYMYSDDGSAYNRGCREYEAIRKLSEEIDHDDAMKIFNDKVDRSLIESDRKSFYWE